MFDIQTQICTDIVWITKKECGNSQNSESFMIVCLFSSSTRKLRKCYYQYLENKCELFTNVLSINLSFNEIVDFDILRVTIQKPIYH